MYLFKIKKDTNHFNKKVTSTPLYICEGSYFYTRYCWGRGGLLAIKHKISGHSHNILPFLSVQISDWIRNKRKLIKMTNRPNNIVLNIIVPIIYDRLHLSFLIILHGLVPNTVLICNILHVWVYIYIYMYRISYYISLISVI